MTMNRGLLLFDTPEPAIGRWENQLGYRGMKEVWLLKGTPIRLEIDCDESYEPTDDDPDAEGAWEVLVEDETRMDWIAFGTFEQCDEAAKKYMREHPDGEPPLYQEEA